MTTALDLARLIAAAARAAETKDEAATAVLDVLRVMCVWFCRVHEDENGCTVEEQLDFWKEETNANINHK